MKSFVSEKLQVCNAKTLAGCAPNQIDFIKKHKDSSTEELQALKKEKESALKDMKKERTAAQAELREKEKTWSRTERNMNKAIGLIKQLEKMSKSGKKEHTGEL